MDGWIKIHRKIMENPIVCKDTEHLAVWIYLLCNATHQNINMIFEGKKINLNPGQLITGRKIIAKQLNISESKVQRILKLFEIEHQIEQQTNPRNRLITINKWEEYQSNEQQIEQQLNNKRTTTEQQLNTNKNVRTKECKNVRNKKENIKEKIHFAELVSMTNDEYEKLITAYGKDFTDQCISVLDNYKGASGKKYKDDYRAVLNWVIDRVKEKQAKQLKQQGGWDYINKEYRNIWNEIK